MSAWAAIHILIIEILPPGFTSTMFRKFLHFQQCQSRISLSTVMSDCIITSSSLARVPTCYLILSLMFHILSDSFLSVKCLCFQLYQTFYLVANSVQVLNNLFFTWNIIALFSDFVNFVGWLSVLCFWMCWIFTMFLELYLYRLSWKPMGIKYYVLTYSRIARCASTQRGADTTGVPLVAYYHNWATSH